MFTNRGMDDRSDLFPDKLGTRGPRHTNVAEPEYHDGQYGFGPKDDVEMDMEVRDDVNGGHREYRNERNSASTRSNRLGNGQGFGEASSSRPSDYQPREDRRLLPPQRLYSDNMYSRSRQNGRR